MKKAKCRSAVVISWDGDVYCPNCIKLNVVLAIMVKPERVRCTHCRLAFWVISEKP